jgi:hypothetical protein
LKKLILFTFTLLAVGLLFLSPVTAEAVGSPDAPIVADACATSCHAEAYIERGAVFGQSSETGTVQMVSEDNGMTSLAYGTDIPMYAEVITTFISLGILAVSDSQGMTNQPNPLQI